MSEQGSTSSGMSLLSKMFDKGSSAAAKVTKAAATGTQAMAENEAMQEVAASVLKDSDLSKHLDDDQIANLTKGVGTGVAAATGELATGGNNIMDEVQGGYDAEAMAKCDANCDQECARCRECGCCNETCCICSDASDESSASSAYSLGGKVSLTKLVVGLVIVLLILMMVCPQVNDYVQGCWSSLSEGFSKDMVSLDGLKSLLA